MTTLNGMLEYILSNGDLGDLGDEFISRQTVENVLDSITFRGFLRSHKIYTAVGVSVVVGILVLLIRAIL